MPIQLCRWQLIQPYFAYRWLFANNQPTYIYLAVSVANKVLNYTNMVYHLINLAPVGKPTMTVGEYRTCSIRAKKVNNCYHSISHFYLNK